MKDSNETTSTIDDDKKSLTVLQTMKEVKQPEDLQDGIVNATATDVLPTNKTRGGVHQSSDEEEDDDDDDDDDAENYWTACYAVSFNKRGTLLASGHASGLIPIHDFMGRTMSALYCPPPGITLTNGANNGSVLLTSFIYSGDGGGKVSNNNPKDKPARRKPGPKPKNPPKATAKKKKLPDAPRSPNQYQPHSVTTNASQDSLSSYQQSLNVGITTSTSGEGGNNSSILGGSFESGGDKSTTSKKQDAAESAAAANNQNQQVQYMNGVTSLSWDRRSRTILGGAIEDKNLRLMDNT